MPPYNERGSGDEKFKYRRGDGGVGEKKVVEEK